MGSGHMSSNRIQTDIGFSQALSNRLVEPNNLLEKGMNALGTSFADSEEAQKMVKGVFNHFFNGDGSPYSSDLLTKTVANHPSTQRFVKTIVKSFNELVGNNKGYIPGLFNLNLPGNPRFNETGFLGFGSGDEDNGLRICINDVHAYQVKVVNYRQVENKAASYKLCKLKSYSEKFELN